MAISSRRLVLCSLSAVVLLWPKVAAATPIAIFVEPDKIYQNTENNPCIFYGTHDGPNDKCAHDPAGWPQPVGPTGSDGSGITRTLEQQYTIGEWNPVVGSKFVVGFDVNDSDTAQTIDYFRILFNGVVTYEYAPATATSLPVANDGNGWADYIFSVGCLTPTDVPGSAFDHCAPDKLLPFVVPAGTTSLTFQMQYFANDGLDQVFVITCPATQPNCTGAEINPTGFGSAPEPGSLILLGTGLAGMQRWYRRRQRRPL